MVYAKGSCWLDKHHNFIFTHDFQTHNPRNLQSKDGKGFFFFAWAWLECVFIPDVFNAQTFLSCEIPSYSETVDEPGSWKSHLREREVRDRVYLLIHHRWRSTACYRRLSVIKMLLSTAMQNNQCGRSFPKASNCTLASENVSVNFQSTSMTDISAAEASGKSKQVAWMILWSHSVARVVRCLFGSPFTTLVHTCN